MHVSDLAVTQLGHAWIWLLIAVIAVGISIGIRIPSWGGARSNVAPPVLLGFLLGLHPQAIDGAVLLAGSVGSVTLASWVLPPFGRTKTPVVNALSVFAMFTLWTAGEGLGDSTGLRLLFATAAWASFDSLLRHAARRRWRLHVAAFADVLADIPMGVVAAGSCAIVGLVWREVGFWAGAVSLIPYLVTHRLVGLLLASRRVERLALRAIGRLPEAAGLIESDHSASVEWLAAQLGSQLGVRGHALAELREAAALHEVGLVWCIGSDVLQSGYSRGDVARWGAELLAQSPALSAVTALVGAQADPYRVPGGEPDPMLDLRSQIIKLACETEQLRQAGLDKSEVLDAAYSESTFDYSPAIVGELRSALERLESKCHTQ